MFLNMLNGGATGVGNCVTNDSGSETGGFNNHCDWRLPTILELQSILDHTQGTCSFTSTGPCIDPIFGPTAEQPYWSSTTDAAQPSRAWFVHFGGGVLFSGKSVPLYVRAVRGGS